MTPTATTIQLVKSIHPRAYKRLTTEQKHKLFEILSEEVTKREVDKAFRKIRSTDKGE